MMATPASQHEERAARNDILIPMCPTLCGFLACVLLLAVGALGGNPKGTVAEFLDRKSTRLNSSHRP